MNDQALSLKLFLVLTRANQSVFKKIEQDIKNHALNPTEFGVLELLYHKGDQPIQKIGSKILLASSSLTYVMDKLEKKQLIQRKSSPSDRRVTFIGLTPEGTSLLDEIFPKHASMLEELFSVLGHQEKEELIRLLKKMGKYAEAT